MERIARDLTDYIIRSGVISPKERETYQYGFQTALELSVSFLVSMLIAAFLHMVPGGVMFFLVFIPLRSYAGGLHLKNYAGCLILSCLTYLIVLLTAKYLVMPQEAAVCISLALLVCIRLLHPVNHENRTVEPEEERYFTSKLNQFICLDGAGILLLFFIFQNDLCIRVIAYTLCMIIVTMVIAKLKGSKIISI